MNNGYEIEYPHADYPEVYAKYIERINKATTEEELSKIETDATLDYNVSTYDYENISWAVMSKIMEL